MERQLGTPAEESLENFTLIWFPTDSPVESGGCNLLEVKVSVSVTILSQ